MKQLGYDYRGPQYGSVTYHLFVLKDANQLSLRHIHCDDVQNNGFLQLVGFRDYLNSHPDVARNYAKLKKELAAQYPDNRVAYTKGKNDFIQGIYLLLDNHM